MRLAFDATPLLGRPTGVGVVTREVLDRLVRRPGLEVTCWALCGRREARHELRPALPAGAKQARIAIPSILARPLILAGSGQGAVRIELVTGPTDVVHGTNYVVPPIRNGAAVVTVHDLTMLRYPKMCTVDVLAYPALIRHAIDNGAWVHTVSEAMADEVRDAFPVPAERVVAVPNGMSPPLADEPGTDAATGHRLAGTDRYILAIGTIEPRKDLPALVDAFDAVAGIERDLRLVVAGPDGWGVEDFDAAVARAVHGSRVVRLGWVGERDRAALLRGASVLAYPSRYEGFGLVPLEAMAVGTPVVTTTAGALPEVVGDAAELVAPGDREGLASALGRVLTDGERVTDLVARGHERVKRFSWDATTDGLVALYDRAHAAR